MKKRLCALMILLCLSLAACTKTYSSVDDYHMIYDNVNEANKTFFKSMQKDTLFDWGEYTYCSYLILFPREQPKNLTAFEYYWMQSMDYDDYSIYFTYELGKTEYSNFKNQIGAFTISYGQQENKPVYTEDLFEYPTYILSWSENVMGSGFCEYIMLDDETQTVINVYKMFCSLDSVQEKAKFNILPKNNDYSAVEELLGDSKIAFAKNTGYCVYSFKNEEGKIFIPSIDSLIYNCDFLNNS